MINTRSFFILGLLVTQGATAVQAGSIWANRHEDMKSPYVDDVARNIGDILTITISEDSKIDNKAKRDLQKSTDRQASFDGTLDITTPNHNILPRIPSFNMDASSSNNLQGKADYKDERKYLDSITAVVMDVLPNGNLIVMGKRDRDIAGDIQQIEISGIVRPSDIAYNNTISSVKVANFRLVTHHKGVAAPYNKPGWLGRVMDVLWPW
jgi:flagellar L-ring protein precursor FlgH